MAVLVDTTDMQAYCSTSWNRHEGQVANVTKLQTIIAGSKEEMGMQSLKV